jgi:hypothetical protein
MRRVSEQPGRYQRSAGGMVGAMLVLLALIAAFVLFRDLNRTDPVRPVPDVNYAQTLSYARDQARFAVLAPDPLPAGWRATTVEFVPDPTRWHLGMLTDDERYVGIEQAMSSPTDMVETYVGEAATRSGTVTIDGTRWRVWSDSGGDTALVRQGGEVTTLVVGRVSREELTDFVAHLTTSGRSGR